MNNLKTLIQVRNEREIDAYVELTWSNPFLQRDLMVAFAENNESDVDIKNKYLSK